MSAPVDAWRSRGRHHELLGEQIFVVEVPATGPVAAPPLLVLHGFPTSSFDFHGVVDALATDRRVVLFDMLGYGLSAKPDRPYRLVDQADLAQALCPNSASNGSGCSATTSATPSGANCSPANRKAPGRSR